MTKHFIRPLSRVLSLSVLALSLGACAHFGAKLPEKLPTEPDAIQIRKDVEYLAAERLEGRGLGSEGLEQAAQYLVKRFAEIGLEPGGPDGSYYERFDVVISTKPGVRTNIAFAMGEPDGPEAGAGKEVVFGVRGYDFVPAGFSSEGEFRAPLVLGGHCNVSKNNNDFGNVSIEGKVVLCLPGGSASAAGHGGGRSDRFRAFNLRQKNAAAVLFVSTAEDGDGAPLPDFQPSPMNNEIGIPVGYVRRSVVERMLEEATGGALELGEGPAAVVPGVTAGGRIELMREAISTPNVVGIIRAGAPEGKISGEAAVLGAHYDHLGWGGAGSMVPGKREIHPGADDNASGVAVMLEAARILAANPERLRRDVFVIAFAGEEEGLLGSAAFVKARDENALEDFVGMVNLDMVGRLDEDGKLFVFGAPSGSEFEDVLGKLAGAYDLELEVTGDSYGPSDHASFLSREIPAVHFFTGAHSDYHRPSDTPEKLNYEGMARVSRMTARMVLTLASDPYRPTWSPMVADEPGSGEAEAARQGYGAWFGSVPDFSPVEGGGVRLAAIRPGSPAQIAGVKAGDVLRKLGPHEIRNLYDFTHALRSHEPGETLDVYVERGGKLLKLEVTLGIR